MVGGKIFHLAVAAMLHKLLSITVLCYYFNSKLE